MSKPLDDITLSEIQQDLQSFGAVLGRQAMAEVMLMRGSLEKALELAEGASLSGEETGTKINLIPALELSLRILLRLNRPDEALATADEAFKKAEQTGYRSMMWRIKAGRAQARKALGDKQGEIEDNRATANMLNELIEAIPDAELRRSFETSPLVAPFLIEQERRRI